MESNLSKVGETINAKEYMTSKEIAEIAGKQHSHVMEAIRVMEAAWVKQGQSNFRLTYYVDQWNRKQPIYELNKSETLYIATKFNDEARAKLVIRWEELEKANRMGNFNVPKSFREALLLAAEQQEVIENQQKQIEEKMQRLRLTNRKFYSAKRLKRLKSLFLSVNLQR